MMHGVVVLGAIIMIHTAGTTTTPMHEYRYLKKHGHTHAVTQAATAARWLTNDRIGEQNEPSVHESNANTGYFT